MTNKEICEKCYQQNNRCLIPIDACPVRNRKNEEEVIIPKIKIMKEQNNITLEQFKAIMKNRME